ncbi:MAG: UvrD-helicase domain-containing protein [Clostridia bacterium]|nr:UvrD-helicase domain-containing protein [Clostridia bacterium]
MATNMTDAQRRAIQSSGKNVLVSASAGAGKTYVMIERIIRLILEEGVDVSNVLAVTFTKLAASEMKQKLVKAVIKKINEGKDVARMRKTLAEIPTADISTIHSFCLNLLKTYFYSVNLDPDFSVLEETKARELSARAIDQAFAELYTAGDESFLRLVRFLRKYRGDSALKEEILEIYKKSVCESDPDAFLDSCENSVSLENYGFYEEFLLKTYKTRILAEESSYNQLKRELVGFENDKLYSDLNSILDEVWSKAKYCLNAVTLQEMLLASRISVSDMTRKSSDDKTVMQLKSEISAFKQELSEIFKKIAGGIPEDRQDDLNRYLETKDTVKAIVSAIRLYRKCFSELKEKEGALDFSDLEHKTLELLKENADVLSSVKEKYKYIFADEYQDVNGAQEEILSLISTDNLFMVGDVKQSIYAFRGCNPDIFATKFDDYLANASHGEAISLDKNFRSSSKVLHAVNNVFSSVITKEHGGVDYSQNPMQGASVHLDPYGDAFLHVIDGEKTDNKPIEGLYNLVEDALSQENDEDFYEGALVSKIILSELEKTVYDEKSNTSRPVTFGDIAVLTRNSSGYTDEIIRHLVREGVPVVSESKANILDYPEIKLLIDILKLIDFFADDPPLASVLKSSIGKVSDEELARIRTFGLESISSKEKPSFLACVEAYSESGDDQALKNKLIAFKDYFDKIRILSEFLGAGELIAKIMRETGLDLEIAGRNLGKIRLSRVERFIAESMQNGKPLSASEFLDKINSAESFSATSEVSGADAVKVMSMHSSKGLEYPIVIIPGLHKKFNALDDAKEVLFSRKYGLAVYHYDEQEKVRTSTLARTFFKRTASLERANEEARILYVAMTRAKVRLHLVTTKEIKERHGDGDYLSTTSFTDFLSLKDMPVKNYTQSELSLSGDTLVKTVELTLGRQSLVELIFKNLSFEYPYIADIGLPLKASVTSVNTRQREKTENISDPHRKKPHLEEQTDLLAQGTAYHKFLQLCDFEDKNGNNQLIRLLNSEKLTEEEAKMLDVALLDKILSLPVWDSLKGYTLYREQPFLTTFTARELYGESSDAKVLVQGIIDLIAVKDGKVILIDYKTSDHQAERLRADYSTQLLLYKKAIEKCLDLVVEKSYILSLKNGELVEM